MVCVGGVPRPGYVVCRRLLACPEQSRARQCRQAHGARQCLDAGRTACMLTGLDLGLLQTVSRAGVCQTADIRRAR